MIIEKITPKENFILHVVADNQQEGLFDVSPYLNSEAFSPLKERNEFNDIFNGKYFVEWGCGADLSADTIEAKWQLITVNDQ